VHQTFASWLEAVIAGSRERMNSVSEPDPVTEDIFIQLTAATLGEPYARYLGDGVRELRPTLDGAPMRVTYWLNPNRTVVLLTVFRKTKMREDAEVQRAKSAQKTCLAEHGSAHEEFVRIVEEGVV